DAPELGDGAAPARLAGGGAGGDAVEVTDPAAVPEGEHGEHLASAVGPADGELVAAAPDAVLEANPSRLDVLERHAAGGQLGDAPLDGTLERLGSCDGREPFGHEAQAPQLFQHRSADRHHTSGSRL